MGEFHFHQSHSILDFIPDFLTKRHGVDEVLAVVRDGVVVFQDGCNSYHDEAYPCHHMNKRHRGRNMFRPNNMAGLEYII